METILDCAEIERLRSGSTDQVNEVLLKFHDMIVESTLRSIPTMVSSLVKYATGMAEIVKSFYNENPQYIKYKDIVAAVLEKYDRENPGLAIDEILKLAAPEIEKRVQEFELHNNTKTEVGMPDLQNALKKIESLNGVL